jgi:hypothetical protein
MKVSPTSYSTSFEVDGETKDVTYRLFYIDFDGEYGDKNTIYLKSDIVETNIYLESETYNADYVQKFNIGYEPADTSEESNNAMVSWLLNSSNWERYCDKTKATAAYGAPSLEMWVKSYNQFLNYNKSINNVLYNASSEVAKTLAYKFDTNGYYVGVSENVDSTGKDTSITSDFSGIYSLILASENLDQTSQVQAQIGMYNGSLYYWLASPSASDRYSVGEVNGDFSGVVFYAYGTPSGVAALVSLQSGITIELVNE